jgi:peptidoglycan/xylan/chitin deacetylase (PgdA/CDA1 family)
VVAPAWRLVLRGLARRRSVIVAYHGVGDVAPRHDPENLLVKPDRFRTQVELLRAAGFSFVTVADLAERAQGGPPPPGFAALSFDDGMDDNYSVLLPMLERWGIPATVYVVSGLIGRENPWMAPGSGARMMTESELRALAHAGIELGAHTVTHPDLSQLEREACLREMLESRDTIAGVSGAPVRTFAYPFCRYHGPAVEAAKAAGFVAAVTCGGRGSWSPHEMKRAIVTGRDGLPSFCLKLADLYQPLYDSVPGRLLRAGTRAPRARLRDLLADRG